MGSFIEKDQVLVVIDATKVIDKYCKDHGIVNMETQTSATNGKKHVLVVEDSKFFRKHITNCLESSGYQVSSADNGEAALDVISDIKDSLDIIVSDIEMPKMDGYALAKRVSTNKDTAHIPMIAVTTRFRESDIQKGMECGFQTYLEKLNEDQLVQTISGILKGGQA